MGKKKTVNILVAEDGTTNIDDQTSTLSKSVVFGAQILEENDRLGAFVATLEAELEELKVKNASQAQFLANQAAAITDYQRKHEESWKLKSELGYWKDRRRRFFGAWHLTIKIDLTPWSWHWKPYWFRSSGVWEIAWLFLCFEALEV